MAADNWAKSLERICFEQAHEENRFRFRCLIPADYYGFKGHFENVPILPGVCQLTLVTEAVSLVDGPPSIARIERMKFHNLIVPNTEFTLEIERLAQGWSYRLFYEETPFSSGKIVTK
ncbi:MAG: hypothetical protein JXX14_22705 [Deltaproteobacteria bacterium]|nr:hypothetical protein [Deltaproteobacteria bacterium]